MVWRLRAFFRGKPRVGEVVTMLDGPNAGETGTIVGVEDDQATVYLDEWNQPTVPVRAVQRVRRARSSASDVHGAGTDVDYEEARTRIRQIPPPMP